MVLAKETECNEKRGQRDEHRTLFGQILSAAAFSAAMYSAYKAFDLANDEWRMAKKYWRIAQDWLDYYKDYYAPVEDQEINEALNLEYVEPLYEVARGRARASAWIEFKGKLRGSMRCTSRYCTGRRTDMLVRIARAQADAVAMADGLGYRNERAYTETRNDIIFERKFNTAKRGRDIIAETPSLGMAAAGIYGDQIDQAWEGLKGAGKYLGYYNTRIPPSYPGGYLASSAGANGKPMGIADVASSDAAKAGKYSESASSLVGSMMG